MWSQEKLAFIPLLETTYCCLKEKNTSTEERGKSSLELMGQIELIESVLVWENICWRCWPKFGGGGGKTKMQLFTQE